MILNFRELFIHMPHLDMFYPTVSSAQFSFLKPFFTATESSTVASSGNVVVDAAEHAYQAYLTDEGGGG